MIYGSQNNIVRKLEQVRGKTWMMGNFYSSAKQTVTIDLNSEVKTNLWVRVLNLNGSVVTQQIYQKAAYRLNTKVLGALPGMYIIQIGDNNGLSEVNKVLL